MQFFVDSFGWKIWQHRKDRLNLKLGNVILFFFFFQETTTTIPMRSKCSPHSEYHTRGSVMHSSRMRTLRSSNRQTTAPSSSASSTTTPANSNHHLNAKQASSSRSPSASTSRSSSKASSMSPRVVQVQIMLLEVYTRNSETFRIFGGWMSVFPTLAIDLKVGNTDKHAVSLFENHLPLNFPY